MITRLLHTLGWIWIWLACALMAVSYLMIWHKDGFSAVRDLLSPFNVLNFAATIITLAPGLGLLWLSQRLGSRRGANETTRSGS